MGTQNIVVGPVRIAFPNVFTPQQTDQGPKYNLTILVDKKDAKTKQKLDDLIAAAIAEKWPDAKNRPAKMLRPLHDADSGEDCDDGKPKAEKYDGFAGHYYASVSSKFQPGILDKKKQPCIDQDAVYGGVWCYIQLNAYAYDNKKRGVSFGLQNVMIAKDDDRLGGGAPDPMAAFADVQVEDDFLG